MKTSKLIRFTNNLYSKPHLISQTGFNIVSKYLELRNKNLMVFDNEDTGGEVEDEEIPDDLDDFDPMSGVGVITIEGALTNRPVYGLCGEVGCSYESLVETAEDMIEAGAKIIVLAVDSPGGEGYGCFEFSNKLRAMCDEAGVKLYAYNDGCMCSAAYAISCVADEVISNPDAETGSIGVLVALINDTKHLEQEGFVRTFVSAGDSKIPFDDSGNWKSDFLSDLQYKVDNTYGQFVAHVSKYTGLSAEEIKSTQAKTYLAKDALALGLINSIMTNDEFVSYILSKQKQLVGVSTDA